MPNIITAQQLSWAQSPLARQVRLSAAAVLQAAQTLALNRIYDEPRLPFTDDQMPCIGIHSAQKRENRSTAGGNVNARNTLSIYFECFTIAADPADAVAQMDVLENQLIGALLVDPYWTQMFGPIVSVETRRQWEDGERIYMQSMTEIVGNGVVEKYRTATSSALGAGGQPLYPLPQPVAAPLTSIVTTITDQQGGTLVLDTNPADITPS
jgi:hypothetical protein